MTDDLGWVLLWQAGNPQTFGVLGEAFRPPEDSDSILDVGDSHLRIKLEHTHRGRARVVKPSHKCMLTAVAPSVVGIFPKSFFGSSDTLVIAAGEEVREYRDTLH